MIEVKRGKGAPPLGLSKPNAKGLTEIECVRDYMTKAPGGIPLKAFSFSVYKSSDVKERLAKLFHRKCAYCESAYDYQSPVDVEHYRPKGSVEGNSAHPGYWWLASEWTNLLPSCIDCNRRRKQKTPKVSASLSVLYKQFKSGKKDSFPVAGTHAMPEASHFATEQPLLIDPTRDDPEKHLVYCVGTNSSLDGLVYPASLGGAALPAIPLIDDDAGLVAQHAATYGMSERGAVSIQCYGLNRLGLVQQRAKVVQQLRFFESILIDATSVREEIDNLNARLNLAELNRASAKLDSLASRIITQMRSYADPASPYSAIAKAYLSGFVDRLAP